MKKCKENIVEIFEAAQKKLDTVECKAVCGFILTPYGVVTVNSRKNTWTGTDKARQWVLDQVSKSCPKKNNQ